MKRVIEEFLVGRAWVDGEVWTTGTVLCVGLSAVAMHSDSVAADFVALTPRDDNEHSVLEALRQAVPGCSFPTIPAHEVERFNIWTEDTLRLAGDMERERVARDRGLCLT